MENRLQHVLDYLSPKGDDKYIYFVMCKQFVKVGIAQDVDMRMRDMQVGNPFPITLLGRFKTNTLLKSEQEVHRRLDPWHTRGEWFQPPLDVLEQVLDLYKARMPGLRATYEFEENPNKLPLSPVPYKPTENEVLALRAELEPLSDMIVKPDFTVNGVPDDWLWNKRQACWVRPKTRPYDL